MSEKETPANAAWSTKTFAFLALFATTAGHALLETGRDALFLSKIPASRLPWVYLLIAAAGLSLTLAQRRGNLLRARPISGALGIGAAGTVAFYALSRFESAALLYALSVWAGMIGAFITLHIWLALNRVFPIHVAKRVFGVLGAGSVGGAIFGSLLARQIAQAGSARSLLLASAVVFVLTVPLGLLLERSMGEAEEPRARLDPATGGTGTPYVRLLMGIATCATIALTMADFTWKNQVVRSVPKAELGAYFATVYLGLNVISLVVQLLGAKLVFERLGVRSALFIVPSALASAAMFVAAFSGLLPATVLKGVDGSLRYSVHKTSMELLAVPLANSLREKVKPLIDLVGQRGGQALASVVILACVFLGAPDVAFAVLVAVASFVWLGLAFAVRTRYTDVFRASLVGGSIRDGGDAPMLDAAAIEALVVALGSNRDIETLAAIRMLTDQGKAKLISPLILFHPAPKVVQEALEVFRQGERKDVLPTIDRVIAAGGDSAAAALRAHVAIEPNSQELLAKYVESEDALLRGVAIVAQVASGARAEEDAEEQLLALVHDAPDDVSCEVARSIGAQRIADFADVLLHLVRHGSVPVKLEAVRAMHNRPRPGYTRVLSELVPVRELRVEARQALAAIGDPAYAILKELLVDEDLPYQQRVHVPRTLALAFGVRSVGVLQERLRHEADGGLRFKALRGLESIVRAEPETRLDRAILSSTAQEMLTSLFDLASIQDGIVRHATEAQKTQVHRLVLDLLADKEAHTRDRVFRLLGLVYPKEDMRRVHRGIFHGIGPGSAHLLGVSRELLENVVEAPLRDLVLFVADAGRGGARLPKLASKSPIRLATYEAAVEACLELAGDTLRSLAAFHAKELQLRLGRTAAEVELISASTSVGRDLTTRSLVFADA